MLEFVKMQGLGNDFVVLYMPDSPCVLTAVHIQQLAHRRLGIGFDQLLVIEAPQQAGVDFHYRIFNADGEEVGQCGNGARCVGAYIWSRHISEKQELVLSTIETVLRVSPEGEDQVVVELPEPQFQPEQLPFIVEREPVVPYQYPLSVEGREITVSVVDVGNPHAVIFCDDVSADVLDHIGLALNDHQAFPRGVNVGMARVLSPQLIELQVFERGVGLTLACGSGACAAMAVGRQQGVLHEQVSVNQLGGSLLIDWQGPGCPMRMVGPAQTVFEGRWMGFY